MAGKLAKVGAAVVCFAMLALAWTNCKPKPRWEKLAEVTNSSWQRFVVAQEHYHLIEGWRIGFWFIDSDGKVYGSLLEMETSRWKNVRLVQTNDTVEVWKGTRLAGTLDLAARAFTNAVNGVIDEYIEGANGVQGNIVTNLVFD